MDDFFKRNKLQILVLNSQKKEEHFHQDIELIYILEGMMELVIVEKKFSLSSDDIIVINSNEKHRFTASENILFADVYITYNLMGHVCNGISSAFLCNSTKGDNENYDKLRSILKQLLLNQLLFNQNIDKGQEIDFEYISQYFHMLELLKVHFLMTTTSRDSSYLTQKSEQRILQISDYIHGNYAQPISLQNLSEYLYLSEGYLSRYFKQTLGMSFSEYLKQVRLSHALDEILYTDRPITKIAYDNGFSSVSFFNRIFKQEYRKTPSSMRGEIESKEAKKKQEEEHQLINKRLDQYLSEKNVKDRESVPLGKKNKKYSVKEYKPVTPIWNQLINIGKAVDLLKTEIQEHIILLRKALNYRYVRFWNIFSKELLIDISNDQGEYNFAKLDQVMDFILSINLKPFIDLEEKIERINENVQSTILYNEKKVEFASINQWERLIETLMRHWIKRYGVEELSEWKIEVWYGGYCISGKNELDSYFTLFKSTYQIVKRYVPDLEVGGCGVFPELVSDSANRKNFFWKEWVNNACRPDFISILNYSYDRDIKGRDQYGKRSTDNEYLTHSVEKLQKELKEVGIENIKLYISEWNLTISDRNYVNDSCFQGAYVVKNIIDVYDKVDIVGYFNGSDRTSEYYDSNKLLHGGQGLLSKDGIFKPAAFAMEFLNRLYPFFINKSENLLITTNLRNSYGIICHNMKKLSYYYYLTDEEKIEKDKIRNCFEDRNELELEICLDDVENGNYQIKMQRINESSGSVLYI